MANTEPAGAAVLATVRAFVERRPDERLDDLLHDDLAERTRLFASLPHGAYRVLDYRADIRELAIVALDEGSARCRCDARLFAEEVTVRHQTLPRITRYELRGEIELVATASGWRISDYPRHGLPVRSTFRLYRDVSCVAGDYVVRPRLFDTATAWVRLLFEVENRSSLRSEIASAYLRVRRFGLTRMATAVGVQPPIVESGASRLVATGWEVVPSRVLNPLEVELVLASPATEAVQVALRLPGPDELAPERRGRRQPGKEAP